MSKIFAPNRQRVLKQAMEWFVELQSEHCDEKRQQRFQAWLAADENHQWAYREAEKLWTNMDNLRFSQVPGLESARKARPRAGLRPILSTLLLVTALVAGWQDYTTESIAYTNPIGQRRSIDLVDGSHIELNAASRLSVRFSWLRRHIELFEGEAQFTVSHEALRPFTVQAGALQVRDIGTVFTIRKHQQETLVTVVVGEVTIKDGHSWLSEDLEAGFSRKLDKNGHLLIVEKANIKQATGWISGVLVFDHTPLAEVVEEFARQQDVQFLFADPTLSKQTVNGSFESNDLNSFLKALEKMLPIRVSKDKKTIVLSKR